MRLQFNKNVEIIWDNEQNSDDEDCIIVEPENEIPKKIVPKPAKNVKSMKVELTTNSAISEPRKVVKPSNLGEGLSLKQTAAPKIVHSDVIDLLNDAMNQSSEEKSLKLGPIPTRSFYSEEVKVDVHNTVSTAAFYPKTVASQTSKSPAKRKATKRKAASKAASNIKDTADDIFDFDYEEPKAKQKMVPLKAVAARKNKLSSLAYTARSPFKRDGSKQGRKLLNADEIEDVEMIEEEKLKQIKVPTKDELTGESFRVSFCANKKNQDQRVLENLNRINDECGERQKVSFSYRAERPKCELEQKNKQQQADSTVVSDVRKTFC